ncbi:MAG: hypothetical protein GX620_06650 [Chloroflexi bacterium]|nr:hypothetical protein [Chloroflexota bacterium]
MMDEPAVEVLAEGENFSIWRAEEPDGEVSYHLELGTATLHLFEEEWEELVALIKACAR